MSDSQDGEYMAIDQYTELLDGAAIRYLFEIGGRTVSLACRVRGRVQHTRKMKNVNFVTLDNTGDLQLVFTSEQLGANEYAACSRLRQDSRIEAWITTEYQEARTPPIRLLVNHFITLPNSQMAERRSVMSLDQSQSRIYLAAIARSIANCLVSHGWVEAEPLTISTSLDQGVDPLLVIFPGLGAETALVVSPIAELAEIAQATGTTSLFAVSRIYSRAIRDGFTSPESLTVTAVSISQQPERTLNLGLVEEVVASAFEPVKSRLSQRERSWLDGRWEKRSSRTIGELREVSGPVHEIITLPEGVVFRSVWPHPTSLVEGHVRVVADGAFHSITVHCERVMHLVSDVHYRRLVDSPKLT